MNFVKACLISVLVAFLFIGTLDYVGRTFILPKDYRFPADFTPYAPGIISSTVTTVHRLELSDGVVCSGFVIDDNYLITAAHCIHDPTKAVHITERLGDFTVLSVLVNRDIALIGGNFKKDARIKVGFNDSLFAYLRGVAVGYPNGSFQLLLSPIEFLGRHKSKLIANGYLHPGMSGGPLIVNTTEGPVIIGVSHAIFEEKGAVFVSITGADEEFGIR